MKRALTAYDVRELDRASAELGMPVAVLMENAGAALAAEALALARPEGRFIVLCGMGNNGGDGMVAARRLGALGRKVHLEFAGVPEALEGEPRRAFVALVASGLKLSPPPPELTLRPGDVVVDALLGTGINRAPEGKYAEAVARISQWRAAGATVLAADVPSGLQSDTGAVLEPCVTADVTLVFGAVKVGQLLEPGASRCGLVRVADIGIPASAWAGVKGPSVEVLDADAARSKLPRRAADTHKGTYGHVLVVAGSWGKTGAAALTGIGALRAGAGLVTVATRPESLVPVLAHAPELMGWELVSEGALGPSDLNALFDAVEGKQALVIGPGISRGEDTAKLLGTLLEELEIPCVLDADALNAIAGNLEILERAKAPLVLTPHPGEMARLIGKTTADVQADRLGVAGGFASARHLTVVLKGARTVIAREDGGVLINTTGNAGMATAGCGDVLAGMCGALLAQGLAPSDAAAVAVYAHGRAGDLAAQERGQLGLMASDLLAQLGKVWTEWER